MIGHDRHGDWYELHPHPPHPPDCSIIDPLLAVLAAPLPLGSAPANPVVAASIRARLGVVEPDSPPLAPLPVELPSNPEWALGVDHPVIRVAVAQSPGAPDPDLHDRVTANAVNRPDLAAQVLVARPDLATPDATQVMIAHRDHATPDLLAKVARVPWAAARVITAHRDLATANLLDTAARWPSAASQVIVATPPLPPLTSLRRWCGMRMPRRE